MENEVRWLFRVNGKSFDDWRTFDCARGRAICVGVGPNAIDDTVTKRRRRKCDEG